MSFTLKMEKMQMIWAYLQTRAIGRFHLFLKLRNWGRTVLFLQAYLQRMELLLLCTQVAVQASQRFVRCLSFPHFASLIGTHCMVNLANRPDHSLWLRVSKQKKCVRPISHISRHWEQWNSKCRMQRLSFVDWDKYQCSKEHCIFIFPYFFPASTEFQLHYFFITTTACFL